MGFVLRQTKMGFDSSMSAVLSAMSVLMGSPLTIFNYLWRYDL